MSQSVSGARVYSLTGRRAVIAIFAIILALLIARNMLVQIALDTHRSAGLSTLVWPRDATLELLDENVVVQDIDWQKHDPQSVISLARDTHRLDPLDNWPFMLAGSFFERVGDHDNAIALFRKSVRLDPRSPAPRLHLIQNLIQARQSDEALTEIVQLARLRPDQDKLMMQALVILLVRDPERIIARLNAYPDVRDRLLAQASLTGEAEPLMARLLSQPGIDKQLRWEQIDLLAQRDRNETAYTIWRQSGEAPTAAIFDPEFQGLDGPAEFRWRLINNSDVVAEFSRETAAGKLALDVEMFGDSIATATQQKIRIAPGSHRIAITGRAIDPPEVGGTMRWDISCVSDDRPLARISFPMNSKRTTRQADITIPPSGCAFQNITLTGIPDAGSQPFRMRFTRISIN